jgi:hypothetical protein
MWHTGCIHVAVRYVVGRGRENDITAGIHLVWNVRAVVTLGSLFKGSIIHYYMIYFLSSI